MGCGSSNMSSEGGQQIDMPVCPGDDEVSSGEDTDTTFVSEENKRKRRKPKVRLADKPDFINGEKTPIEKTDIEKQNIQVKSKPEQT